MHFFKWWNTGYKMEIIFNEGLQSFYDMRRRLKNFQSRQTAFH